MTASALDLCAPHKQGPTQCSINIFRIDIIIIIKILVIREDISLIKPTQI